MKPEKVIFIDEKLEHLFGALNSKDPLKRSLTRAIQDLQENSFCGRNVKKKLIPKKLIQKHNLNNIWIYNLPDAWRMIYTLTSSKQVQIIAVILDWMNHKEYEKLFKF